MPKYALEGRLLENETGRPITSSQSGFQRGGDEGDLFRGTAEYYAVYRRPYPAEVVQYCVRTFGLNGTGRLLDAGCGTGQAFRVFAKYFASVFAFDRDREMVRLALKSVRHERLDNVVVYQTRAEDLQRTIGPIRLAIFAASFHWMDRQRVAEVVYDLLEPGGHIAIFAPSTLYDGSGPLETAVRQTVEDWLGRERRAGDGVYVADERHAEALAKTRFRDSTTVNIHVEELWTPDEIVGWLYSTSFANKTLLQGRAADFEADLRARLRAIDPCGNFARTVEYTVISSQRPRTK